MHNSDLHNDRINITIFNSIWLKINFNIIVVCFVDDCTIRRIFFGSQLLFARVHRPRKHVLALQKHRQHACVACLVSLRD